MIVATDFDGTLYDKGNINHGLIAYLKQRQTNGDEIILWSCREGKSLQDAVRICDGNGLRFNAVNCNTPAGLKKLGHNSRKVYADMYIDDKAVKP